MPDDPWNGSPIDRATARALSAFYERTTRAGFLSRVGGIALRALGITLAPLLPVSRMTTTALADGPCDPFFLCGIYGRPCKCEGCNTDYTCPDCAAIGFKWTACCTDKDGKKHLVEYPDCCGNQDCANKCKDCTFCRNNATRQPLWCFGGSKYVCTKVVDNGPNTC
jgi:hypothetical protein